ncbi:MAG: hypothetical protein DRN61_04110, partial [Thaumarchaeota archaeon]
MKEEVKFLLELLKKYSPTGSVDEAREFLLDKLKEFGLNPKILSRGAIVAETGRGSGILLCGHLDTIPGEIPVKIDRGIITGRGVVDAKGPLAAMIQAMKRVLEKVSTKFTLIVSVDEEEESESTLEAIRLHGAKNSHAIIGEPSRTYGITVSYYGKMDLLVRCKQKSVHPSATVKYESSMEISFKFYFALKHRLYETIGRIPVTPQRVSSLDNKSSLFVSFRYPPRFSASEILAICNGVIREFGCSLDSVRNIDPYEVEESSKIVRTFVEVIKARGYE